MTLKLNEILPLKNEVRIVFPIGFSSGNRAFAIFEPSTIYKEPDETSFDEINDPSDKDKFRTLR